MAKSVKPSKTLPKLPSALIRLALEDLKWIEKNPAVAIVDMMEWVEPVKYCYGETEIESPVCAVCFAGAVMRRRLNIRDANGLEDESYLELPEITRQRVESLERFRGGIVYRGLNKFFNGHDDDIHASARKWSETYAGLHDRNDDGEADLEVAKYDRDDPKPFHTDMMKIVKKLEKIGL